MRSPIKAVHVVWRLSRTGGVQAVVRQLLARLDRSTVDARVLSIRPRFEEDGLEDLPEVSYRFVGHRGGLGYGDRLRLAWRVAGILREMNPDVVHTHSGTAIFAMGGLLTIPGAHWILDMHDAPGRGRHSRITERLEGTLGRRPYVTAVAHSTSVRAEVAIRHRIPLDRVELIPLGIDTSAYAASRTARERWRRQHEVAPGSLVALYVTRVVPAKNVDLFLEVARTVLELRPHRGLRFVVLGGGADLALMQARADTAGLNKVVRFLGPRSHSDLVDALSGCDLFLSTSDYEGFGLAVLEAMAARRPVVATAVGGHLDLVEPGVTGLLADPGDALGLAAGVCRLADDAGLRDRMGAAAAARARDRFDAAGMVGEYSELYQRLTAPVTTT